MKFILTIFSALILNVCLIAQPYNVVKYSTMIETADQSLAEGDYYRAVEWYEKAYKEEKSVGLGIQIADLHYRMRNYKSAERWYKRLVDRDRENQLVDERYILGKVYKEQGKYEYAIEQFLNYLEMTDDEDNKNATYRELKGIKLLDSLEENIEAVIRPLDRKVNSAFSEYSATDYDDGKLYFASFLRKDVIELDGKEEDYHAKIYTTQMGEDRRGKKSWEDPVPLGEEVNRKGFHNANQSFSSDGKRMFFTRSGLNGNNVATSEIFVSYNQGGSWGPANIIEGVNGDWIAKHPVQGELFGKEVLFFSADMEGGYGGFDIYYATLEGDNVYSTPNNLGEVINSSGDEVTPYYDEGTLYFSTDGHPTIGGYDIYFSTWNGSTWSSISNMGNGYNSSYDDLYLRFDSDSQKGYLVSNRPYKKKRKLESETCCDDIFSIEIREIIIDLLATIQDENGPLIGASADLTNLSLEQYSENKSEPNASDYRFLLDGDNKYKLVITKDGYYPDSVEFNTAGILDDYTVNKTITLKPIPVVKEPEPTKEPETEIVTINQAIRLNNIYYDFDDDKILNDAEIDLNLIYGLMNDYPDMVIELSSHTDAQGIGRYNEQLSQRRAESAKRWLVNKGVQDDRIVAKGYGESKIINHCVNGVRCSDEEHRFNRRTEFTILEGPETIEIRKTVISRPERQSGKQSFNPEPEVPVISFDANNIDLGVMKKGEKKEITYIFTNTGSEDLVIDMVTACKCTELYWTKENIKPGEQGAIKALFDSSDMKLGKLEKTIDIIANTDPIVVEAVFTVEIVE
jgi:peptidoglycan-associated lipoprotein